jgi:hypothetical protein
MVLSAKLKLFRSLYVVAFASLLLYPHQLAGAAPPLQDTHPLYLPLVVGVTDSTPRWQWTPALDLELSPSPNNAPRAVIDRNGQLHLFWDTSRSPRFIYHTYFNGEAWTDPQPIAETLGISEIHEAPVVAPDNTIHIVWNNNLKIDTQTVNRLMYASFDGSDWSVEEEVYRPANSARGRPHFDSAGSARITLLESNIFTLMARQLSRTESGWMPSNVIKPENTLYLQAWPDIDGGIRLYGAKAFSSNQWFFSHWINGDFHVLDQPFTGTLYNRRTQADTTGNLYVFWTGQVPIPGGQVTGVYHQCINSNLVWNEEEVLTGQNAGTTPIATSDQASSVAIAWRESQDESYWFTTWEGCTQTSKEAIPLTSGVQLSAVSLSHTPVKVCAVARYLYGSTRYQVVCADKGP